MALLLCSGRAQPASLPSRPILDARVALIVVDLQRSVLSRPTLEPLDRIVSNARLVLDAFRRIRENVARFGAGQPLTGVVDPALGY